MSRRAAFTLIELLVVIAIIAVIAAILFPVFSRAREKARAATCLSNMRQLNSALAMYTQDNDEVFPGYAGTIKLLTEEQPPADTPIWTTFLMPYVRNEQIVICPSASNSKFAGVWKDRGSVSIGYNTHFGEWFNRRSDDTRTALRVTLAQMQSPSVNVTFGDGSSGDTAQVAQGDPRGYDYRGYIISNWDTRSGGVVSLLLSTEEETRCPIGTAAVRISLLPMVMRSGFLLAAYFPMALLPCLQKTAFASRIETLPN